VERGERGAICNNRKRGPSPTPIGAGEKGRSSLYPSCQDLSSPASRKKKRKVGKGSQPGTRNGKEKARGWPPMRKSTAAPSAEKKKGKMANSKGAKTTPLGKKKTEQSATRLERPDNNRRIRQEKNVILGPKPEGGVSPPPPAARKRRSTTK